MFQLCEVQYVRIGGTEIFERLVKLEQLTEKVGEGEGEV